MTITKGTLFRFGLWAIFIGLVATNALGWGRASRAAAVGDSLKAEAQVQQAAAARAAERSAEARQALRDVMAEWTRQASAARDSADVAGGEVVEGLDDLDDLAGPRGMVPADSVAAIAARIRAAHAEQERQWAKSDAAKDSTIARLLFQVATDSVSIDSLTIANEAWQGVATHWEDSFRDATSWNLPLGIRLPGWTKDAAIFTAGFVVAAKVSN